MNTHPNTQMDLFKDFINAPIRIVHSRENNAKSQKHLEARREKLNKCCIRVLSELMSGRILTTKIAVVENISQSFPRRAMDCRDKGFRISQVDSEVTRWFCSEEDIVHNIKMFLEK